MAWSSNNAAHKRTWTALYVLEQSKKTFDKSAGVVMRNLAFWTPGDSVDMRRMKAKSLAIQLDNLFCIVWGAKYEPGVTRKQAIEAMTVSLTTASETMEALADANDANYVFL